VGVAPEEIFFTDDRLENVEAARQAGFDAVQFVSVAELREQLRVRMSCHEATRRRC
jgi:FMN phosphatase YigB (HAD superfamily)